MIDSFLGLAPRAASGWVTKGPADDYWYEPRGVETIAGADIDEDVALTLSTVYACVAKVSKSIAALPLNVVEKTGPNTRVPAGSFWAFSSTAALSSKRMYDPSRRPTGARVRTMIARTTSPFATGLLGATRLADAMISSPNVPTRVCPRPMTRMHMISWTPLLSVTRSRVSAWIIAVDSCAPDRPRPAYSFCSSLVRRLHII